LNDVEAAEVARGFFWRAQSMVWRAEDPQGHEALKVRYDLVPYLGDSLLDIGCGATKVFDYAVGIDSLRDVHLLGRRMRPDLVVPDASRLPMFSDGAFHTVFSSHVLEHIEDFRSALAEWWRLVKADGHLILYLPDRTLFPNIGEVGSNIDHKHDFVAEDILEAMCELASGWDCVVNERRDQLREYSFLLIFRKVGGERRLRSYADPKPKKTAAVVRPGAYGDALWASSLTARLKSDGYHVTLYTGEAGEQVMRHDPNIDRLVLLRKGLLSDDEWLLYYLWERAKYDRWINLIGSVESALLPHPNEIPYYWPEKVRRARMGQNYLEAMYEVAELDGAPAPVRFTPTPGESRWARDQRRSLFPGQFVVIAPTGSGLPKTWPHTQALMDKLAAAGIYHVVLGDVRQELRSTEPYGAVLGTDLPVRLAYTLAHEADAVVGIETGLLNAVANAPMLKVAMLVHSTPQNLTKHWTNTVTLEAEGVPCHPCHRLHHDLSFCAKSDDGWAACMQAIDADTVARLVIESIPARRKAA
jgi:ADP-heptose:LPS heptosyltransferase